MRAPHLGEGCEIGAGAVIIGGIRVGEGAIIGRNAVVMHDIAAGSRVLAPPSREVPAGRNRRKLSEWQGADPGARRARGDAQPRTVEPGIEADTPVSAQGSWTA